MQQTLRGLPLLASFAPLGISVEVLAVEEAAAAAAATAAGEATAAAAAAEAEAAGALVRLRYAGPPKIRLAVEMQLRTALRDADPRVGRVEFE